MKPLEIAHSEKETGANKGNPFQEPKEEKNVKKKLTAETGNTRLCKHFRRLS